MTVTQFREYAEPVNWLDLSQRGFGHAQPRMQLAYGYLASRESHFMRYPFDGPGFYAIQVAGEVDDNWSDRLGGMTLMRSETADENATPVTVLLGLLADQAALAGVLDTLYQNRYPLLYMKYLGPSQSGIR